MKIYVNIYQLISLPPHEKNLTYFTSHDFIYLTKLLRGIFQSSCDILATTVPRTVKDDTGATVHTGQHGSTGITGQDGSRGDIAQAGQKSIGGSNGRDGNKVEKGNHGNIGHSGIYGIYGKTSPKGRHGDIGYTCVPDIQVNMVNLEQRVYKITWHNW